MGKGLHELFKTVVKEISQDLLPLGEYGSEVYHLIPEPRKISEAKMFSDKKKKTWLKATLKEIKHLINNQTFIVEEPYNCESVTSCMDVYKAKIQYGGILDKFTYPSRL